VPARKKHRGFQSYMYARRRPSDAELARNQEAADRILPPGPTIDEVSCNCCQSCIFGFHRWNGRLCCTSFSTITFTCKI
jgi:hypothetical protein